MKYLTKLYEHFIILSLSGEPLFYKEMSLKALLSCLYVTITAVIPTSEQAACQNSKVTKAYLKIDTSLFL